VASQTQDRIPLPPRDAQSFDTVCQFCIVGCGYKVFKWPVGRQGSPRPSQNALGVDFTRPLPPLAPWISAAMHAEITERDGRRYNLVIMPDSGCVVNEGLSSVRGGGQAETTYAADRPTKTRLHAPLISRGDDHRPIPWEEAIELGARVTKAVIDRWGPDAVGMKFFDHGGGGGGFENNWAVGKFFFTGVGTRTASIHNRPAYNSETYASIDAGVAALSSAYVDAQLADTIVLVGSNAYETQTNYFLVHMIPNLSGATLERKQETFGGEAVEPGRMIIVDPRRTMTVATAETAGGRDRVLHLQIEPGSDIVLLNAIGRVVLERRWHDPAFISRSVEWQTFEAYQRSTLQVDRSLEVILEEAARAAGVSREQILQAASWIAEPKADGARRRTLFQYEKGLIWGLKNYENVAAIVDLALLTGNLGKPGTGCSRMGGHQEAYVRPPYPGGRPPLNVDEAIRRGEVKLFWVGGCNPALTTLNARQVREDLSRRGGLVRAALDRAWGLPAAQKVTRVVEAMKQGGMFVVVQEIYMTETARSAHLVYPAATWGEMDLTSINGERRLRLYQKFMDPPGVALPDWRILALAARRLKALYEADGNRPMAGRFLDFDWQGDEEVFIQARYQFTGQLGDPQEGYAGVTYELLRRLGTNGIQTPTRVISGRPVGTVRLHEDGRFYTPTGKARFIPAPPPYPGYAAKVAEQRRKYPFWVNNGRTNHVWQTLYHHQLLPFYQDRLPLPWVEIHPADAAALRLRSGDEIELYNDYGAVRALAYVTDAVKRGHTFMLFGQPRGVMGNLVTDHVDPTTTIPYYKGTWAAIRRIGSRPEIQRTVSFAPQNVAS